MHFFKFKGQMSTSVSEKLNSIISQILPISELIEHMNRSIDKPHLNEPQNLLLECTTKMEIENLSRARDIVKKVVCQRKRALDLSELSNLKLEDKLRKNQRKCEELEKTITLLTEEKNQRDRKCIELENKNIETERRLGVYLEKCESLDAKIVKMSQEIEGLRRKNVEADETIEELRLKKLESDRIAEEYKNKLDKLSPRITKIEKDFADMLNVKVGDSADLAGNVCSTCNCGSRSSALSKRGRFGKFVGSSYASAAAAGDIIEISDSDDETNPDGADGVSNVGENEMNFVPGPSSSQRSKQNRMDADNLIVSSTVKIEGDERTRDEDSVLLAIHEKENQVLESRHDKIDWSSSSRKCVGEEAVGQAIHYQTPVDKFDGLNDDEVSTDTDDSCTDSRIDKLIASLRA